jgi:hypothetical protein
VKYTAQGTLTNERILQQSIVYYHGKVLDGRFGDDIWADV